MRAFTGMLEIGDETVAAAVQFSEESVRLLVAEDEVGTWPADEVEFVHSQAGYDIRAEDDSIRFLPDQDEEFGAYIHHPGAPLDPADATAAETPVPPEVDASSVDEPGLDEPAAHEQNGHDDIPDPTPDGQTPDTHLDEDEAQVPDLTLDENDDVPDPGPDEDGNDDLPDPGPDEDVSTLLADDPEPDLSGLLTDPTGEEEAPPLLSGDEGTDEDPEEPGISVDVPDEYFAAGLNGPSADLPAPRFQSALTRPDGPAELPATSVPDPAPAPPPADTETEEPEEAPDEPEPIASLPPRPARETESPDPGSVDEGTAEDEAPSEAGRVGRLFSRLLQPSRSDTTDESPGRAEESDGDLPAPISDSDNLKQWMLVGAGGVVLLVIVGVVAWGLISLLGDGDPTEAVAAEPEPAGTSLPTPSPTTPAATPATSPPLTTVPAENLAAAEAFVTSWNEIARDYAYHLTISADSLPVSTAPAPTVHLTYQEDGTLELTMAPRGTGTDRDILVAMGLAVAWADPDLSPEGRKQLLGAMGVDVDDPQVADMGGELERNGVSYSTEVNDGVIRFRVIPSA